MACQVHRRAPVCSVAIQNSALHGRRTAPGAVALRWCRVSFRVNAGAICSMVVGPGRTVGEHMINDARLALVSFTGSSEVRA